MAKTLYNQFDVVKFASSASILTTNDHAKDYIGIVKAVCEDIRLHKAERVFRA